MINASTILTITEADLKELKLAVQLLENPGIAAKMTNLIGSSIEKGFEKLPKNWNKKIGEVTKESLFKAMNAAIFTMKDSPGEESANFMHKIGVAAIGGVGGFFGISALAVELPISTTIMLRSIADIARSYGESIDDDRTKLACMEVFALGGKSETDDGTESGYYAIRTLLAKSISETAEFIANNGIIKKGSPILIRFITKIAERFGVQITEKLAAQAIPLIGAAGGAMINTLFIDHFQDMARGHFIVRKLERTYSEEVIRGLYDEIKTRKNNK